MTRAIRDPRARSLQGNRAGAVSRALAVAVNVGAVFLLYTAALGAYAVVHYLVSSTRFELPHPETWIRIVIAAAVALGYLTFGWSSTGRTLGEQIMGLRVVTSDGGRLSGGRAFARALLALTIGAPGMILVVLNRRNDGLHDMICHTAVVYDWHAQPVVSADPGVPGK